MKRKYDYASLLKKQCDAAASPSASGVSESERCYSRLCKMLIADFLPPIARDDIAAISYAFLDMAIKMLALGEEEIPAKKDFTALIELSGRAAIACVQKEKACRNITADLEKAYLRCSEGVNKFCDEAVKTGKGEKISTAEKTERVYNSIGEAVCLIRSAMLRSL